MFNQILGQLCPMMVQQLQRSKSWEIVEQDSDPAELMKLIRKVCLHGGNNALQIIQKQEKLLDTMYSPRSAANTMIQISAFLFSF